MDESKDWDPLISHFYLLRATRPESVVPQETAIVLYEVEQIHRGALTDTHLLLGLTPARSFRYIPLIGKEREK